MYGQQEEMMSPEFQNVEEDFELYDTVGVYRDLNELGNIPPGWFTTFSALSNANALSFFDMRNRANTDLAYNNQDTRDQTAFALKIKGISVAFWAATCAPLRMQGSAVPDQVNRFMNPFWELDLPQHASLIFRIQQDEKLKINALMAPSGSGPVGGGYGQFSALGASGSPLPGITANSQGITHRQNQWQFPTILGIPRRASIGVRIELSEWARNILRTEFGPFSYVFVNGEAEADFVNVMFGITVTLTGKRLVQQRGELHA